jgi:type IV secretory pathway component VirB8
MQIPETPSENPQEVAEAIRSGEFFRESRSMYDTAVHDPMAERYFYVMITGLAASIFLIAFTAMNSLYPLESSVPFIVNAYDLTEEVPVITTMLDHKGENIDHAMLRFMTSNYLKFREEYNIATFDRGVTGLKSQSSEEVFKDFERFIDPRNPESPITLYQRHSTRRISIVRITPRGENNMEVIFDAFVDAGRNNIKKTSWQANITFNYSGIALDEETGKVKPISFIVTQYRTKRIQVQDNK